MSKPVDQFRNTRRFAIALYSIVVVFDTWVFAELGKDGVSLLVATLPTLLIHAMAYMHISNRGEPNE